MVALLLMIALVVNISHADEGEEDVVFKLSFDETLQPEAAVGRALPRYLEGKDETPQWDEGIVGQGMLTGAPDEAVRFFAESNFPVDRGTVAFWMRGLPDATWHERDSEIYNFFLLVGDNGWLRLYKYPHYDYTFLLSNVSDEDGTQHRGRINLPQYRENTWNHFAFSWTESGRMSFYLNGRLVGQQNNFPIPRLNAKSHINFGQWSGEGETNRVMDEVVIHGRALSPYEIARVYREQGDHRLEQQVVVPYVSEPMTVDGEWQPKEWQHAAVIPLAINEHRPTDTVSYVYLAYDDARLYVGLRSPLPAAVLEEPDEKLLRGFFTRDVLVDDEGVNHDDSFDINLIPRPDEKPRPDYYRLVSNTIDTTYDYVVRSDGTIDLPWDPDWKVASHIDLQGWTMEASIPFAGLEVGTPVEGETWQVNFHRIWKLLRDHTDSWSVGRRDAETGEQHRYAGGRLIFGGKRTVSVRMHELKRLHRDTATLAMELVNHDQSSREVRAIVSTDRDVLLDQTLTLEARRRERVQVDVDLRTASPVELHAHVQDAAGEQTYGRIEIPLHREQDFDIVLRSYPSEQMVKLEADLAAVGVTPSTLGGRVHIRRDDETLRTVPLKAESIVLDQSIDVSDLAPGRYSFNVEMEVDGQMLLTHDLTFEQRAMPAWYGNRLGMTDQAPAPWTPVELSNEAGLAVQVWNRTYHYGHRLLPTRITAGERELLSRPMTLMMNSETAGTVDLNERTYEVDDVEASAARASWTQTIETPQVRGRLASYVEFDGMNWVELEVEPTDGAAEVDSLILTIPMPAEQAALINAYDYSLANTGTLPAEGWTGNLRPLWLGDEAGGIQFFAESSHTWHVKDRRRELEVVREGDEVLLKVNLIDMPLELTERRRFAFGFQATPVKPMHPDRRRWRIGHPHITHKLTPEQDVEFLAAWAVRWAAVNQTHSGEVYYPMPREDLGPERFRGVVPDGRPFFGFPYYQLHIAWGESDAFAQFGDEWLRNVRQVTRFPSSMPYENRRVVVCQNARSLQDFVLHGFEKLHQQAQPRGYYFDVSRPAHCNNVHHGCGYAEGGQYQTTFNILGARELAKRIYVHLKQHDPDGLIIYHASGQIVSSLHGFADIIVDGENHYSRLDRHENRGYENFLTLDRYRAEYMGHNLGASVALLPQFTRAGSIRKEEREAVGPQPAEYLLGLPLLHDSQLWIAFFYDDDILKRMYRALAAVDFASADYTFVPYWAQTITQPMSERDAVVSFYVDRDADRAVAVVMNLSHQQEDLSLRLDPAALGFTPTVVEHVSHDEPVTLNGRTITMHGLPSHAYRIIQIR